MDNLTFVHPVSWRKNEIVTAVFTTKNEDYFHDERNIPGLNLGFNTNEDRDVVEENRKVLYRNLDIDPDNLALVKQVHSNRVVVVDKGGYHESADAMITTRPGLTLGIQVADCSAVLLADSVNKVIAAAHAGWRGAVSGIVKKTIDEMVKLGSDPENMSAYVSPCIGVREFEVGEEVARQFPDDFVDYLHYEKPHVDLKSFIRNELVQKGIAFQSIEIDPHCTKTEPDLFYSYRREREKSGRMMGLIRINDIPK